MKRCVFIIIILVVVLACIFESHAFNPHVIQESIPILDLKRKYPIKEINVNELFSKKEYIKLETRPDFLLEGRIAAYGDNIISFNKKGGNIFIFDRTGKALRKINQSGRSPQEYIGITDITFDEKSKELFVLCGKSKRILVYDIMGVYKRSFSLPKDWFIAEICNSANGIICCGDPVIRNSSAFFLISPKDGSLLEDLVPFNPQNPFIISQQRTSSGIYTRVIGISYPYVNETNGGIVLNEPTSDTVFLYTNDQELIPQVVCSPRKKSDGSIQLFFSWFKTESYHFFTYLDNSVNKTGTKKQQRLNATTYVLDLKSNQFYIPKYTGSKNGKEGLNVDHSPIEPGIFIKSYSAYWLVNAFQEGKLDGKLKELAYDLNENDNPVLSIIKFK